MKPEQFIREFGVEKAREVVANQPKMNATQYRAKDKKYSSLFKPSPEIVYVADLKRLVESLDLFKELKTKKNANREFMKACMRGQTERANQIKRAIEAQDAVFGKKVVAVHESIYGGGDD